jgi:cytochrome c oxidase subunit 3
VGIEAVNPFAVPLLNTAILLGSGATVTWAHHSIVSGGDDQESPLSWNLSQQYREQAIKSLGITIFLGAFFTLVQGLEYYYCPFSISDSCFGSTFFVATGFHGLHVLVGTILLIVS